MSTVPGESTWADAGLIPFDGEYLPEIDGEPDPGDPDDPDEHRPEPGRPDLRDEATEHDVVDQLTDVPDDETDDYPEG